MNQPKKFPTLDQRHRAEDPEGTLASALNSMKPMYRGGLPDDHEPDVVTEMERALEWATREVPEEP